MKPQKVWMFANKSGQLAPFYGVAFTKKELVANAMQRSFYPKGTLKPVRLTVRDSATSGTGSKK